jgi:hypothetical protein
MFVHEPIDVCPLTMVPGILTVERYESGRIEISQRFPRFVVELRVDFGVTPRQDLLRMYLTQSNHGVRVSSP